jgi:ribonuclease E
MKKSLVISEQDNIAAILENERVVEFFVNRGELLLGDIYSATVENILPGIDAAFVNLGKDKMGFLHANDVPGPGPLKERLVPKQKLLVQITKEPTGHKGPRVSTAISLPGRFLVLVPEERGVSISRRISEARERSRLKSVVNLMKPPGIGLIIRTEAKGQGENELFEDFEQLWDRWQTVVSEGEASIGPTLIYRDQDLLFRVIRDAYSHEVSEIICDSADGQQRAQDYLQGWASKTTRVSFHTGEESILVSKGIDKEIEAALSDRVELPSGGHLNIQPTEALTVIDVNSGRFTSSRTQAETVRRTNLEAAQEIARQLRLRNIGGMVIVDFIDMDSRRDQQQVLEVFQRVLEEDRAKPQVGQLSDLGLVELTRRRQGQSLRELFTVHCSSCAGLGVVPTLELGSPDNKRVISFKAREEEAAARLRGGNRRSTRQAGAVLRAATAMNGRIVPSVESEPEAEEDVLAYVPEEILEQMPDDLLQGPGKGAQFGKYSDLSDEDEEAEEDVVSTPASFKKQSFAPERFFDDVSDIAEEKESELENRLTRSISEVEAVYQDMGKRSTTATGFVTEPDEDEEEADIEDVVVIAGESVDVAMAEADEAEEIEEAGAAVYEVESPYETEIDPVTGVYRLKAKPMSQNEQVSTNGTLSSDIFEHVADFNNQPLFVEEESSGGDVENRQLTIPVYEHSSEASGQDSAAHGVRWQHSEREDEGAAQSGVSNQEKHDHSHGDRESHEQQEQHEQGHHHTADETDNGENEEKQASEERPITNFWNS